MAYTVADLITYCKALDPSDPINVIILTAGEIDDCWEDWIHRRLADRFELPNNTNTRYSLTPKELNDFLQTFDYSSAFWDSWDESINDALELYINTLDLSKLELEVRAVQQNSKE